MMSATQQMVVFQQPARVRPCWAHHKKSPAIAGLLTFKRLYPNLELHYICSSGTLCAVNDLKLDKEDEVIALIKASNVMIMK